MLERKNYAQLAAPVGPYVHAVSHGGTLYLSGLTAFGTEAQSAAIEIQAEEIFRQIGEIAKAEACGLEALIKVTAFVTEMDRIDELRRTLFNIYDCNFPASSLIRVNGLFAADLKIEIEAILALPNGDGC